MNCCQKPYLFSGVIAIRLYWKVAMIIRYSQCLNLFIIDRGDRYPYRDAGHPGKTCRYEQYIASSNTAAWFYLVWQLRGKYSFLIYHMSIHSSNSSRSHNRVFRKLSAWRHSFSSTHSRSSWYLTRFKYQVYGLSFGGIIPIAICHILASIVLKTIWNWLPWAQVFIAIVNNFGRDRYYTCGIQLDVGNLQISLGGR